MHFAHEVSSWSGSAPDQIDVNVVYAHPSAPRAGWLLEAPAEVAEGRFSYDKHLLDREFHKEAHFKMGAWSEGALALIRLKDGRPWFCVSNPEHGAYISDEGSLVHTHAYDWCAPLRAHR
jgi:hypothetical protein